MNFRSGLGWTIGRVALAADRCESPGATGFASALWSRALAGWHAHEYVGMFIP